MIHPEEKSALSRATLALLVLLVFFGSQCGQGLYRVEGQVLERQVEEDNENDSQTNPDLVSSDEVSYRGVGGARVLLKNLDLDTAKIAYTGPEGKFELEVLADPRAPEDSEERNLNRFRLKVSKEGYLSKTEEFTGESGSTAQRTIYLAPKSSLD